jgi:hypothetical protein
MFLRVKCRPERTLQAGRSREASPALAYEAKAQFQNFLDSSLQPAELFFAERWVLLEPLKRQNAVARAFYGSYYFLTTNLFCQPVVCLFCPASKA